MTVITLARRARAVLALVFVPALVPVPGTGELHAQSGPAYPTRPVRFIVPYPPGGTTDIVARGIATPLSERLGQQVVVDNRGGASTIIGAELVARAAPDGYTLLLTTATTMSINPHVVKKLPYDPVKDYAPITPAVYFPYVIAAHPAVPVNSVREMIELAKARPESLKYSTPGTGSTNHIAGALLENMAGIRLVHVPYKGSGPALTGMLSGEVQLIITGIATVLPHAKTGKAKILGVCGDRRLASWPDIPAVGEAGLKGYEGGTWFGVVTTAGAPRPIVSRLNREIVAALQAPALRDRFTALGFEVFTSTPEEFGAFMRTDMARAAKVIRSAGITAE